MIVRNVVLVIAIIAFAGALSGTLVDVAVWPSLLFSILLLLGAVLERVRYGTARRLQDEAAWRGIDPGRDEDERA